MSLAEIGLGSKPTSVEASKIKTHNHQVDSKVIISPGILGLPTATHEITVTKGTRSRIIKGLGFVQKPRAQL